MQVGVKSRLKISINFFNVNKFTKPEIHGSEFKFTCLSFICFVYYNRFDMRVFLMIIVERINRSVQTTKFPVDLFQKEDNFCVLPQENC